MCLRKAAGGRAIGRLTLAATVAAFVTAFVAGFVTVGCRAAGTATPRASTPPGILQPFDPLGRMAADVAYLASDALEGRGVGTEGLALAAYHVAARFDESGVEPLGDDGTFFQHFDVGVGVDPADESMLLLTERALTFGEDFLPLAVGAGGAFDGTATPIGHGVAATELGQNDYADVDAAGRVLIARRFEPTDDAGRSRLSGDDTWSVHASLARKARVAADAGAVALLIVDPDVDDLSWAEAINRRPAVGGRVPIAVMAVTPRAAETLHGRVTGDAAFVSRREDVTNIVGTVRGVEADRYVVVGAHYDHLGRGGPGSLAGRLAQGQIHPGADDNASGTAVVIELADRVARDARDGRPPARSVIFVLFGAEEIGLLGSQHFVENPPVPLSQVVAMLNFDMVGRVREGALYVGGSGTAEPFPSILQAVDDASPLRLRYGGGGGDLVGPGGLGPSDHQPFARNRVPVLFFFSGLHRDYHRPSDTADKVNVDGMAAVVDVAGRILRAVGTMPPSAYVDTFDRSPGAGTGGRRVRLGVVPSFDPDPMLGGVLITGTSPGSPAERAGLRDGDVIVSFADRPTVDLMALTERLAEASPGDRVPIVITRNGERVTLTATLEASGGEP